MNNYKEDDWDELFSQPKRKLKHYTNQPISYWQSTATDINWARVIDVFIVIDIPSNEPILVSTTKGIHPSQIVSPNLFEDIINQYTSPNLLEDIINQYTSLNLLEDIR
jgi:hypothetical protein